MFRATHRLSSGAQNCNFSLWFYIRLWLPAAVMAEWELRLKLQFLGSWWWAVCRSKHVEQLSNNGIINSTTRSHLVGYFYKTFVLIILTKVSPRFFRELREKLYRILSRRHKLPTVFWLVSSQLFRPYSCGAVWRYSVAFCRNMNPEIRTAAETRQGHQYK